MSVINSKVFEVLKKDLSQTRFVTETINNLQEDEIVLKVDKFALTANNISYGVGGEFLGYWRFFPALEEQWGRLPAMGYAQVIVSNSNEISVGERVWGFFPMASHVKMKVGKVTPLSFMDVSEHRKGLSPVYSSLERTAGNPLYHESREDYEMLLKGLFITSWLVDDFMFDNHYFGAEQYLITSASSKTSIALAFAVKEREERRTVGITSAGNKSFVESLGCYDQVMSYDNIDQLDNGKASILVDMAGSRTTLERIHRHFADNLKFSSRIGATHHDELFDGGQLLGPEPVFFFAPSQMEKRSKEWGREEMMKRIAMSLLRYMAFSSKHIKVEYSLTESALNKVYQEVLSGQSDADIGHIISITAE